MFTVNFEGTEVFMKPIEIERIVIPEFKILSCFRRNDRQLEASAFILQENTSLRFSLEIPGYLGRCGYVL